MSISEKRLQILRPSLQVDDQFPEHLARLQSIQCDIQVGQLDELNLTHDLSRRADIQCFFDVRPRSCLVGPDGEILLQDGPKWHTVRVHSIRVLPEWNAYVVEEDDSL